MSVLGVPPSPFVSRGHPREPETFSYSETTTGPNGFRRVIRSYVVYDSRWPWWRRKWAVWLDPTR